MKILYDESKDRLEFRLSGKYPISNWEYTFSYPLAGYAEDTKKLIVHNLRESFSTEIAEAREKAYNEGWKAAKAKKKRQRWFSGYLVNTL